MIKTILALLISCASLSVALAQSSFDYQPLRCQGEVPTDFTQRISERVDVDIEANIDKSNDTYRDIRSKKEFLLESNYLLDDLLMSGQVRFGDEASQYVNKVADELLKDDPVLRAELRFYVGKSTGVNAFATKQGMIFVTMGLLAQLENEAQLAYILSHEIVHYLNNHSIDSYVDRKRQERSLSKKYNSEDELISQLSNYSRTLEFEADSIGFIRYAQTDYSTSAAYSVFDVLQFSHLPFDEVAFDYHCYETDDFEMPHELKLDTLTAISFDADYDDSEHSHPAVGKRRAIIASMKKARGGDKGADFIVSESAFNRVRDLCRFDGVRLRLRNRNYISAIHNIDILLQKHPRDLFLLKSKAKALYLLQAYVKQFPYRDLINDHTEVEGEISAAYYFFDQLSDRDLRILALDALHDYYDVADPDMGTEKMYQQLVDGIAEDVAFSRASFDASFQYLTEIELEADSILIEEPTLVVDTVDTSGLSKYEKLALQQQEEIVTKTRKGEVSKANPDDVLSSVFIPVLASYASSERFVKAMDTSIASHELQSTKEKELSNRWEGLNAYQIRQALKQEEKDKKAKEAQGIGADKIVYVDPSYFIVDRKRGVSFTRAEGKVYQLYNQLESISTRADLSSEVITPKLKDGFTAESFNDLAIFKDWYTEVYEHLESADNWTIVPSEQEYIQGLAQKKGTKYFAISGVFMYKEPPSSIAAHLLLGAFVYPLAPYILYEGFTPDYDTFVYNIVYDIESSKTVVDDVYHMSAKGNKGNINSYLYDSIKQLNKD